MRLFGALGEREPPVGHFDEKRFMCRSAGCLRQSNALSGVSVTDPSWASALPFEGLSRVGPSYNKWSVWPVCTSLDWPHPYVGTITANSELNFAISWLRGLAIWRDRSGS